MQVGLQLYIVPFLLVAAFMESKNSRWTLILWSSPLPARFVTICAVPDPSQDPSLVLTTTGAHLCSILMLLGLGV